MDWINSSLTAVGLALVAYGLYLAWSPLAFLVGGIAVLRIAWSTDQGDS